VLIYTYFMDAPQGNIFYDEARKCWVGTHPKWGGHVVLAPTKEKAEEDMALALAMYAIGCFRE
jgi:hypothetical protein